jgi:putative CocE/NonD family hydrolase
LSDGTVLRADVYYPTDTSTGQRAAGRFPVVMAQTPYGRRTVSAVPEGTIGDLIDGPNLFMVRHGYISVSVDVRGTGGSQGTFTFLDPKLAHDGAELVDWAAKLPGSSGKVGMYGASYLGATQLFTASAVGKNSPLKAIFPVVAPNDTYKDLVTMGGLLNPESISAVPLGVPAVLNATGPLVNAAGNPEHAPQILDPAERQHASSLASFQARFATEFLTGGPIAYNDRYWQVRDPGNLLAKIVDNGVPAYVVGGEYDLFQRGEPLAYVGLQNAWAGRPVNAPMLPDQKTTGRYQLLDGPFGHFDAAFAGLSRLELEWFDTFLKGEDTGMDRTPTPLHYNDLGTDHYVEGAHYPFPAARPTRFYLSGERSGSALLSRNDGTLSTSPPTRTGSDTVAWMPVGNPCGKPVDQWALGAFSTVTHQVTHDTPCFDDEALGTLGPDRLSYSSPPLRDAQTIAGPITMTVYATATSRDTEWVVHLDDVAPDGKSSPLSEGALLGSFRKLDPDTTWRAPDGEIMQAGHTYSRDSVELVVPGESTRYDIEVLPTYSTIAPGHRIRITLATSDTPHLLPTAPALERLLGGIYNVQYGPDTPSAIELPLIPAR